MSKEKETPHHTGHRDRLRQRFLMGSDSLPDYELLELLLFLAIPRRDVKPISKELIQKFKNLRGVLNATIDELQAVNGISENTAIALKTIQASGLRLMKQDVMDQPILNSWTRLIGYLDASMADLTNEHFRVLFLNKKNILIADEVQGKGTVDHTPAYPREIVKRALELGATALILTHNHPSGDPTPSQDDIDLTYAVIDAAKAFDIKIHDHVIIAKNAHSSFREKGLI